MCSDSHCSVVSFSTSMPCVKHVTGNRIEKKIKINEIELREPEIREKDVRGI